MRPVVILAALIILAAITISFTACQDIASPLEDFNWKLVNYGGPGGMKAALPDTEVTAFFDSKSKTVTGSGGCNDYSAPYEVDHLTLKISGPITQTKIACGGERDNQETAFFNILQNARRFELEHGRLSIYSGTERLIFENTNSTVKPPGRWGE